MRLGQHVPGFHYHKRCKQHGEHGMAEQAMVNAAGYRAIGLTRPSIINDSALLNLARLKHCATSSPNRRASSRITHWRSRSAAPGVRRVGKQSAEVLSSTVES